MTSRIGVKPMTCHAALPHLESAHEHSAPPDKLHVKRVEMLNTQEEEESDSQQEADASMESYERQLSQVRDSGVPRLAFIDHPSEELYWPILDSPDLAYKLFPIKLRPLPGAEDEPTGLIQDDRFRPADTYANDHPTWVPDYPDSHPTSLVDYDVLAQFAQHLPAADNLDALVIFIVAGAFAGSSPSVTQ